MTQAGGAGQGLCKNLRRNPWTARGCLVNAYTFSKDTGFILPSWHVCSFPGSVSLCDSEIFIPIP